MAQDKPRTICAAILGAGQSLRFGAADKLVQPLDGKMLGLHIAHTVSRLNCAHALVIASASGHPCADGWREAGFCVAVNTNAAGGLGTSVALAAKLAADRGADALLVCLADMPFVPLPHLEQMIRSFEAQAERLTIASGSGHAASPPAIFPKALFPRLALLKGNDGARALLSDAGRLPIAADLLADIDTAEDLRRLGGF